MVAHSHVHQRCNRAMTKGHRMKGVLRTSPQTESQRRFHGRLTAHHETQHRSLERTGCSDTCACGHSPRNGALQITHAEAKIAAHKNDKLHCRRTALQTNANEGDGIEGAYAEDKEEPWPLPAS